jgi:hypothetical protein
MRTIVLVLAALAALAAIGCAPNDLTRMRADGATDDPDASLPPGVDGGPRPDGAAPETDAGEIDPIAMGAPRGDICGNLVDDDDDGMIDDGCDCAVGTERPCWLGPDDMRGIGACRDGVQRCMSDGASATWAYCDDTVMPSVEVLRNGLDDDCDGEIDEADGICVPTENDEAGAAACANGRDDDCDTLLDCDDPACVGMAHCPGGCDANESVCWGGVDDDCDGDFDCDDADCDASPSCDTGPCPRGQTPTYRERNLPSSWGASYIAMGDGNAVMPMMCEPGRCAEGQVAIIRVGHMPFCVPPPPECPAGTDPNYVGSSWRCDPPCELLIHYGSIYGGQLVCAGRPRISCPSGQVPTFVYETRTWQCRTTCDNGLYDQIRLDGALVCVPC